MNTVRKMIIGLITLCVAVRTTAALTTVYWDANSDTAGFGTASGTWGSDTYWTTNEAGTMIPDLPASTTISNAIAFGTASSGLLAGAINVSGTQSFDRITFGLASGPIAITNGTLSLTTPVSEISLNSITNTIGSTIAPYGALTVRTLAPLICDGFPTTAERILFLNAKLTDYTGAEAKMAGLFLSATNVPGTVYHWTHNGTNVALQVQYFDGAYTKCVKIQLAQSGNNITGTALYAKYNGGNTLGYNFDVGGNIGIVAGWYDQEGYGVTEIKLLPYDSQFKQYRFANFLTGSFQTIASNATLSTFTTAECFLAGGAVINDVSPMYTCYFLNSGTNASFQAQAYDDGYTKCVKVELVQAGAHIQARAIYAKYNAGNTLGYNFDLGGAGSSIATSFGGGGYGIRSTRLTVSQPTLDLSGASPYDSLTTILGPTLKLSGILGNGTYTNEIINNGSLALSPSNIQRFTGPISGSGSVVMNGAGSTVIYSATTLTTNPVIIATNKTLAHYVAAGGVFGVGSMENPPVALTPYYFFNDGTTATVQLQVYNGGHTKVAKVEFKQVGADITAKIVYTKHCSPDGNNVGADYDYTGALYDDYHIIQVMLYQNTVILSGSNSYLGGTIVNGGELEATTLASLPAYGGIVVYGGNLIMNAAGIAEITSAMGSLTNPVTVFSNGTLTLAGNFNAGYSRPITLEGGVMTVTSGNAGDAKNYVNNLTLKSGARVFGNTIRIGFLGNPTYKVQGTSACSFEAGLYMVDGNWSLEVDDVTGNTSTDLTISGNLNNMPGYGPVGTYKRNAGTLSLSGSNAGYTGPVYIEAGAIRLDSAAALTAANAVYLTGGTLISTTFSNNVGNVSLNTGAIILGTNTLIAGTATLANNTIINLNTGTLAFADSRAATWTAGKTINLVGTLGRKTLRFGTTAAGLTATQLQMITLNGKMIRFILDENGYLVELKGTMLQFF